MAYTFPNTPAEGDIYTPASGAAFIFNEGVWRRSSATTVSGYVLKAGDVMTGALVLPDPNPAAALHATHKRYVDEMVATQSLWQSVWAVAANTPDLDPAVVLPLHGYTWTAVTADPAVPELAPANLPGIGGTSIGSNDSIVWNENALQYEHVPIPLGASAMLVADTPPPGAFHGQMWWDSDSGKQYVWYDDGTSQAWVQVSGGGGASKAEVYFGDVPPDPTFDGELWWDTTTGNMMLNYNGTWVQTNVEEAPVDGAGYVRQDAGWVTVAAASGDYLPLAGGTLTGNLALTGGARIRYTQPSGGGNVVEGWDPANHNNAKAYIKFVCQAGTDEGKFEFWTGNGGYGDAMCFRTTIASGTPGIYVNGDVSALSVTDRTLLADAELAQFAHGDGIERGVDLGQVVVHLLERIKALEAR